MRVKRKVWEDFYVRSSMVCSTYIRLLSRDAWQYSVPGNYAHYVVKMLAEHTSCK